MLNHKQIVNCIGLTWRIRFTDAPGLLANLFRRKPGRNYRWMSTEVKKTTNKIHLRQPGILYKILLYAVPYCRDSSHNRIILALIIAIIIIIKQIVNSSVSRRWKCTSRPPPPKPIKKAALPSPPLTHRRIAHAASHLVAGPPVRRRTVPAREAAARRHFAHFVRRRVHGHGHAGAGKVLLQLQRLDGVKGRWRINVDCLRVSGREWSWRRRRWCGGCWCCCGCCCCCARPFNVCCLCSCWNALAIEERSALTGARKNVCSGFGGLWSHKSCVTNEGNTNP